MSKPMSVQLYSVRQAATADFFGVLKQIADMGYVGVEFAGLHGKPAQEVARVLKDLGLVASSAHVPMLTRENIGQLADDMGILGNKRIISGFGPKDMETEDGAKACAARFAAACELATQAGLSMGMHNHWWEFDRAFGGKTPFQIIMEGAPSLFSELDIYWSTKGGADTPAVIRAWAKRMPLLHIKDGDLEPDNMHKAAGDGKINIRAAIEAADPAVLDWVVVELDNCKTNMFEAVRKSCQYLAGQGLGRARR